MNAHIHIRTIFAATLLLGLTHVACGPGLYDLPAPPPKSEWTSVDLVPGAEEQRSARNFLNASAAAMDLYGALIDENWAAAWALLSEETKLALNYGHPSGDGIAVLKMGEFVLEDETGKRTFRLDPILHFFVDEMMRFEDEAPGQAEAETNRRKEIYALSRGGENKKIVLIYEAGGWKLHKTTFKDLSRNIQE